MRKGDFVRKREHLSRGVMVSVGVSGMEKTHFVFVKPGAKVNSGYYREHVLRRCLLPVNQGPCGGHNWAIQQDAALCHMKKLSTSAECYLH